MESKKILQGRRKKCSEEYVGLQLTKEIDIIGGINAGSFGDIYLGRNVYTMQEYAIKFDKNRTKRSLENFDKEYRILKKIAGKGNFPRCFRVEFKPPAKSSKEVSAMVMERLGPNIYDVFKLCDKRFSHGTVCWLMQDFIARMKEFHHCGLIHRDIKPENFCLGGKNLDQVYLIDFGLSKNYVDSSGSHIPLAKGRGFVGTRRYASRYAHKGYLQSRRDDMEAIGYLAVFLIKGTLPWQDLKMEGKTKKEKHRKLYEIKKKTSNRRLCYQLPPPLEDYLREIRSLEYEEEPRYDEYIDWFYDFCEENELERDFDWEEDREFRKVMKGWKKYQARMKAVNTKSKTKSKNNVDEESTKD